MFISTIAEESPYNKTFLLAQVLLVCVRLSSPNPIIFSSHLMPEPSLNFKVNVVTEKSDQCSHVVFVHVRFS